MCIEPIWPRCFQGAHIKSLPPFELPMLKLACHLTHWSQGTGPLHYSVVYLHPHYYILLRRSLIWLLHHVPSSIHIPLINSHRFLSFHLKWNQDELLSPKDIHATPCLWALRSSSYVSTISNSSLSSSSCLHRVLVEYVSIALWMPTILVKILLFLKNTYPKHYLFHSPVSIAETFKFSLPHLA